MAAEKWDGEVNVPGTRRIGYAPEEIPNDGEWYVLRSESVRKSADRAAKRVVSQRITQAISYMRRRQVEPGDWPGFEMAKVRDDDDEEMVTWHLVGRWT